MVQQYRVSSFYQDNISRLKNIRADMSSDIWDTKHNLHIYRSIQAIIGMGFYLMIP